MSGPNWKRQAVESTNQAQLTDPIAGHSWGATLTVALQNCHERPGAVDQDSIFLELLPHGPLSSRAALLQSRRTAQMLPCLRLAEEAVLGKMWCFLVEKA